MEGKYFVYFLFLLLLAAAAYAAAKGLMKQDSDRENKWAEYEHRNRKDKR